ncbi:MAG: L-histidine N(alpha)-methyltransferase [Pyrinomonadaceae bacterium]
MTDERLKIHSFASRQAQGTLAEDVYAGLMAKPKSLPPKYFYDAVGSALFDVITLLPEYYPTRAEAEILENFADEIVAAVAGEKVLLELGSGSATKTRVLIEAILKTQNELLFIPNDISPTVLEESSRVLLQMYANLSVEAYAADYFTALENFKLDEEKRVLALFLGSNIGNFTYEEARKLMTIWRKSLKPGDCVLLGTDLKKDFQVLIDAYDDPTLVTAAFNLNLLARLNRELDADFDLRAFRHLAIYNEAEGRVEMHLESLTTQRVNLEKINLKIDLAAGETIHTENSYKFNHEDLTHLAAVSGFELRQSWFDSEKRFASNLFQAV